MNSEVEALLVKAESSIEAARVLQREGFFAFAVSRIYYAMFYVAEALLLSRGLSFSSHAAVIAAFGKEFAKTGAMDANFHKQIIVTQSMRLMGDYEAATNVTSAQVDEALRWAQDFLTAARSLLSETK